MSIQLERDDFSFEAVKTLSTLLDNPDFCDVTLVCEDQKRVFAHKAILSANSSFFQNTFTSNPQEMQCIYLRIKFCHLQAIITFIYTGQCKVAQENFQDFLEISKDLEIGGLANIQDIKVNKITSDINLSGQLDGEAIFHKKGNNLFEGPANFDSSVTKILNEAYPGNAGEIFKKANPGHSNDSELLFGREDNGVFENFSSGDTDQFEIHEACVDNDSEVKRNETFEVKVETKEEYASKCNECNQMFMSGIQLKKHMREAHSLERLTPCVKSSSSQQKSSTTADRNSPEEEDRLTYFENNTSKAYDKNFHTFILHCTVPGKCSPDEARYLQFRCSSIPPRPPPLKRTCKYT